MAAIIAGPAASTGRALRVGSHTYPLVLPSLADPRLHLAGVIFSLQFLGQVALGFELSIAQILVSLATVAVLEVTITFWQRRAIEWPASALLTGNGVAFIFRVPGTAHGDWWSMRGAHLFAAVAAISLLSKYLITYRGGHLFNPSNLGLVVSFLILGPRLANPQDLWWGPMSIGLGITLALIVCGGLVIASRLRLLGIAVAFWLTYAFGMGVLWAFGHCMTARWNVGPVCGASFWTVLVTSPEILVFLFFMITDPKTVPGGRVSRIVYGIGVGVVAAVLASAQRTEFATKVSILAALVIVCALRPVIERLAPAAHSEGDRLRAWLSGNRPRGIRSLAIGVASVVAFAGLVTLAGIGTRHPVAEASVRIAETGTRPAVSIPDGAVPPISIDDSVHRINTTVDEALADKLTHDLFEDLLIETRARTEGDPTMVATAAAGPRLTRQRAVIEQAAGGAVPVETHNATAAAIVSVGDVSNPQASPTLGVRLTGTLATAPASGSPPTTGAPTVTTFETTFTMVLVGEHYLILDSADR